MEQLALMLRAETRDLYQNLVDLIDYYIRRRNRTRIRIRRFSKLLGFLFRKVYRKLRNIVRPYFYPRRKTRNLLDRIREKKYIIKRVWHRGSKKIVVNKIRKIFLYLRELYNSLLNHLCVFYAYYIFIILAILIIYFLIKFRKKKIRSFRNLDIS